MTQFALFIEAPVRKTKPTPDVVRERLEAILAEMRAADSMPWSDADARRWVVTVPQMCKWLPEGEAAHWRAAFEEELARFGEAA